MRTVVQSPVVAVVVLASLVGAAAPAVVAQAAGVRVPGKTLKVSQKTSGVRQLKLVVTDDRLVPATPCEVDGELAIQALGAGAPVLRLPLEAGLWQPIGATEPARGCRYRRGPVVPKARIKAGKSLKVVAEANDLGIPLETDPRPVRIEVRHGDVSYCVEFGGEARRKPGRRLMAKHASAARACPPAAATDPAAPGPFNVGIWLSTIEDHVALDGTPQPLPLVVWYPTDAEPGIDGGIADALPSSVGGAFPLVIFSHGASSSPTSSSFLTEHLATHGFVVAAVQHPNLPLERRAEAFANRPGEVHAAVDFVVAESKREGALLQGAVDDARLGVMGHSFGALTTLALLGESDNRFMVGMPMAPGIRPGDPADVSGDLEEITVPLMFMMGERDTLALYSNLSAAYSQIPDSTRRYAFVFPTGTHFAYTDACLLNCTDEGNLDHDLGHQLVKTYGTAFLQRHLSGQADFASYLDPRDDIEGGQARLIDGPLP